MHLKYILVSDLLAIEKRFTTKAHQELIEIPKSFSVKSGDDTYVLTEPNTIQVFKWGMIQHNASEQLITIARSEGNRNINDNPSYNGSKAIFLQLEFKKLIFNQRCIVVADAFYVWSDKNQPHLVYLQGKKRPIGFAGIYDIWQNPDTGKIINGFSIITTSANEMLQKIGVKRMPVILPWQFETNWLKPLHLSEVLRYLVPYTSEKMNAYPVSELISTNGINDPSLIKPIGEKLQDETIPISRFRSYYPHKSKTTTDEPYFKKTSTE